jgi:response regulator RpfG family c-di-GMP phosphodiesterase/signal transduction histidine kinase
VFSKPTGRANAGTGAPEAGAHADLLFREEAQNELFLNTIFLVAVAPAIACMMLAILVVQGLSRNALLDLVSMVLLLAYHAPLRARLKRGGYRDRIKYFSVTVNILICSFTLIGYSFSSGWVHAVRTIVAAGYFLAIALSGLYHDPKLPAYAAAMSIAQYSGIAAYAIFGARVPVAPLETFGQAAYSFDAYAFLVFGFAAAGAVAAYGCSRFRSTLARSLSSEASNKAITELDAQKTYFFSNVSHELRTPLTLILSPLEAMLAGDLSYMPPKQREYLEVMRRNSLSLLKLINGLLDFTKIEAGKMKLNRQRTELAAAMEYYVSTVRPAAEAKGLALALSTEGCGDLTAFLDRYLFEKAFFNLLSNALKFTERGGRIGVSLRPRPEGFELSVSDTGIGIPADKLDFIFERFNQVDSTLSRRYEGTGIGLSLARDIVELHGGRIWARSELGRGSTFTIEMPAGEGDESAPVEDLKALMPSMLSGFAAEEPVAPPPGAAAPGAGKAAPGGEDRRKVLVVDDNRELREYLRSILEGEYEVVSASDGNEGLRKAVAERPDLVLSDVMMPGMNGFALCAAIKREAALRSVPVILLTARTENSMVIAGYEVGADDYLDKPFGSEELLAKVRAFMGREDMRRRLEALAAELGELNARLEDKVRERTEKLEERFYQILDSLAMALEEKDPYTQGHSLRVERYSLLIADELGMAPEGKEELSIAARLHDIGKIGIPEAILNKQGELSDAELAVIRTHPERGARILSPFSDFGPIVEVTSKHHERYDGKGYLGCPREEIPLLARILSVADSFDAMTTTRAYRPALSLETALLEIEGGSGSQFDPEAAAALVAAVRAGALDRPRSGG